MLPWGQPLEAEESGGLPPPFPVGGFSFSRASIFTSQPKEAGLGTLHSVVSPGDRSYPCWQLSSEDPRIHMSGRLCLTPAWRALG